MKNQQIKNLKKALDDLIKSSKTLLDVFSIDGDLITIVERNNPHISKQGGEL